VPELEARLKYSLRALGRRHHQLDIFGRDGHRLLAEHVNPGVCRTDSEFPVLVVRQRDVHGIERSA